MEGGDSVVDDIRQDRIDVGALFRLPDEPLKPWFDKKSRWEEELGLELQFSLQSLHQRLDSGGALDQAAAGRAEINGLWTLAGRDSTNPGQLSFRLESRTTLGTTISPYWLGVPVGSGSVVGTGFSDFGNAVSELAWRQTLLDGRLKFAIGKISAVGWYGGHTLSSPKRGFQNSALLTSNTRAAPERGLGAVVAYQITPNFLAIAGIHDANAETTGNPFETIGEGEYLKSAEVRWYPSGPEMARWNQVRLMLWHQDERKRAGVASSQGAAFVASYEFSGNVVPFLVGGLSDGNASIFRKDLGAGVGIGFNRTGSAERSLLGIAAAWGEPSNADYQEQVTAEAFYRFQLFENVAVTPSVQAIKNPIANPEKTAVIVAGLRLRLTF